MTMRCDQWPLIENKKELNDLMNSRPLWKLLNEDQNDSKVVYKLLRNFDAKDFKSAIDFIKSAGEIAELHGHHPDIHLTSYRNVKIIIYTHRY